MFEKLKAAFVALMVIFVFVIGGVLIGLKLPETDLYKRWHSESSRASLNPQPTKVAVIQIPGTPHSEIPVTSDSLNSSSGLCSGGVCKLPGSNVCPPPSAQIATASPDLTFYDELADKPTESGGSVLRVKKTPEVKKRKVKAPEAASKAVGKDKATAGSGPWELRICSLPQEIKARLERSKLIKDFPGVEIEPVQVAGKGTWYRVKITDIANRDLAERYQLKLRQKYHYKPIVRLQ